MKRSPAEQVFARRLREGNLQADVYIRLADMLLNESSGGADLEKTSRATYCLRKAHEIVPYSISLLNGLLRLMNLSGDASRLPELERRRLFLEGLSKTRPLREQGAACLANKDSDMATFYFQQALETENLDIEALSTLADIYVETGKPEEALSLLETMSGKYTPENPYAFYFHGKAGMAAFLLGDFDKAGLCFRKSAESAPSANFLNLLAETELRRGAGDKALTLWKESLSLDPLQMPVYLKMYDTVTGFDCMVEEEPEKFDVNILFYTFNKLDILSRTLESLALTDIAASRIILLDNHSTDGTAKYLKKAGKLFPGNKVRVITLPTNIGAPAARNFLMAQPENERADFAVYMDDDVILKQDWLKRMLASMSMYPKAAVVGGKVVNKGLPKTIQSIYRYIDTVGSDRLSLSDDFRNNADYGQFDLARKAAHVMGCCHMMRITALKDVGEFDIRLSPSQFDDLDHDFITSAKGYEIVYNGYVEVVHVQKTGKEAFLSRAAAGNVRGNEYKLVMKRTEEEMLGLRDFTEALDRSDLRQKISALRRNDFIPENCDNISDLLED